jgi:hypothetical protein
LRQVAIHGVAQLELVAIMAVADAASVRTVAVQLRSLSADEENQPIIAREDGCLRALISFVNGDDMDIVTIAVAAVKNLASHPDNFGLLRGETELIEGLKELLISDESDRDLKRDIFDILEELTDEKNDDEMDELDELEKQAGLVDSTQSTSYDNDPTLLAEPITTRLHIPNISDDVFCSRVEQLVIRKHGVISVVFEIGAEVAVIYARLASEELSSFMGKMTGANIEVMPNMPDEDESDDESDEQRNIKAPSSDPSGIDKENGNVQPGYLDETGERFRDVAQKNAKKKNTISQGATSLAARLEAQRQEEARKKARANRLMDSIGRGFNSGWGWLG